MADNKTTSVAEEVEGESLPLSVQITAGVIIVLVILTAVVGNVLTITAFIRDKQLRIIYNIYILNLAIADLLIACVSMPFYAVYTLTRYSWPFGYHFCKMYMVIDFTICLESVLIVMILSYDRLLLIKQGTLYLQKETTTRACVKVAISWVIAFLLYSPAIIGWDLWTGVNTNEEGDCDVQFAHDFGFTTVTAVCEFVIPFLVITILNSILYKEIRKRLKMVSGHHQGPTQKPTATTSSTQNDISGNDVTENPSETNNMKKENENNKTADRSKRRDIKAAKYLAIIVLVFFITWFPYTITTIVISFCESCVNEDLYEFFNWVLWCKAAINPFLYALNSERFRLNFQKMICTICPFCKNSKVRPSTIQ